MAKIYKRARVRAFRALFEAEFGRCAALDALRRDLAGPEGSHATISNATGSNATGSNATGSNATVSNADRAYAEALVQGLQQHREQLDRIIAETAPRWPLDQIAVVDLTILRIALYELLVNNAAVPTAAVINEAVELAKTYGADASSRFVNGVLGTVSRDRLAAPVARKPESEEPHGSL